ncbi:Allene oxide synthase-lipoxygenase protein [Gracilariopsis chorda]|uniref:Allene oxide synthase-lipoxygenase protein n=1 Tax=Gracilariopsis chorda TaxID=448386 RepID=A0A2V3IVM0_9FLOR|nr:Allene oxide synthase-lipoxygenase protein [Gracilariopsis chorda]|eukprot:PXF46161.1 Allene oxide synthase-lipoxygenase protein [Gracilariopsis chorda]
MTKALEGNTTPTEKSHNQDGTGDQSVPKATDDAKPSTSSSQNEATSRSLPADDHNQKLVANEASQPEEQGATHPDQKGNSEVLALSTVHTGGSPDSHVDATVHRNMPADVTLTLKMFAQAIQSIGVELFRLANEWQDGTYARNYLYEKYPYPFELPRRVVSLPQDEAFSSRKIGAIAERAHIFIRSQMPFVARLDEPPHEMFADIGHDAFRAFFGNEKLFPMPRGIIDTERAYWKDDSAFAAQFLNGCNPTVIERVTSMQVVEKRLPEEMKALTDPEGRTITQLVSQNALFWADYWVLQAAALKAGAKIHETGSLVNPIRFEKADIDSPDMLKHFYAPFVAFYLKSNRQLGVLGIMLTRHKDKPNAIYTQETCRESPNTYLYAKMHVACADNQLHQFYSHLGRCHLIFESFGVAVRNVFKFGESEGQEHIVGKLLGPHFRDHIAINWLARNTLVAHGKDVIPFTDAGFALGAAGGLILLALMYDKWTLSDQAFPQQLRNRGFDPEKCDDVDYYYCKDGMMIWNALRAYVERAVKLWYNKADDSQLNEAISRDRVLQSWCAEMRDTARASVTSFPERFETWELLCDTVTTIMYSVSAEHSAVNTSQERYLSYVPNRPNALFKPVPLPSDADMNLHREILMIHRARGDDDDVGASMPLAFAMFQVQFAQLLTLRPERTLMQIEGEGIPRNAVAVLKRELEKAHYMIKSRNMRIEDEDPGMAPYEFLDPTNVAQSIEI